MLCEESESRPEHMGKHKVVVQGFVTRGKWIRRIAVLRNVCLHLDVPSLTLPQNTLNIPGSFGTLGLHSPFPKKTRKFAETNEGIEINVMLLLLGPL